MLTLVRWLARWPLWLLHSVGRALGWVVFFAAPGYRARFRENAARAGVPWPVARAGVGAAGCLVLETPRLWLGEPLAGTTRVELRGAAALDAAHEAGRGLVLLTPHLGCFEVAAQAYAHRFGARHPLTVLYRPARQAWLADLERVARDRAGLRAVPASLGGVRGLVRALRRGETVGLLPDQVPPAGLGVWAPFFGHPAYTMTLAARLAQQTGASVALAWGERLPGGQGYVVHLERLDTIGPAGDGGDAESAALVNRAMERLILACPQQYLWGYDRYKAPREAPAGPAPGSGV
jgi:Kdo2-lipid IVA lauroyltransferase/acyltransferase